MELDSLMIKYRGKEDQLLMAIKQKYNNTVSTSDQNEERPWQFVLKNYEHDGEEASLEKFQAILEDFASTIGGECVVYASGQRKLVVRQVEVGRYPSGHNKESIYDTVQEMRRVVHKRYEHIRNKKSIAHLHTEEHMRRKEEKRVDLMRKNDRDKSRRGKG